jgi:hypothetical protein
MRPRLGEAVGSRFMLLLGEHKVQGPAGVRQQGKEREESEAGATRIWRLFLIH